ncbi:CotS family spore coat protein [Clostridium sediminicola]|uniref:CotS family spore coat protein n=1 Tax=Clostridium sediminicola TaxID=3114879 RepID=UPI0031F1E5C2
MDKDEVKSYVEKRYNLKIQSIEQLKNVFKIKTTEREYCLKTINYGIDHFLFIVAAIKHLQNNNFENIPQIIKTDDNKDYIELDGRYAYFTEWVNAKKSDYSNEEQLKIVSRKLAELHLKSENFKIEKYMKPRVGWLKWIDTFSTRKCEILDFKERILKKTSMDIFDKTYLNVMDEELIRAENSINNLKKSLYFNSMKEEIELKGFCHHDFAYHNILIDDINNIYVIDFDYCILDTHLHDLASLLIRRMKYNNWSIKNSKEIISEYNKIYPIKDSDIPIMAAFMEFPQDYWQRGIQYYWEKKNWGIDFFMKKLTHYIEDRDKKQSFINEFKNKKVRQII